MAGIQALLADLECDSSEMLLEVAHTLVLHLEFPGKEEQFCHMGGHTQPSSCKSKISTQSWLQAPLQQARSLDTLLAPKIILRKALKTSF